MVQKSPAEFPHAELIPFGQPAPERSTNYQKSLLSLHPFKPFPQYLMCIRDDDKGIGIQRLYQRLEPRDFALPYNDHQHGPRIAGVPAVTVQLSQPPVQVSEHSLRDLLRPVGNNVSDLRVIEAQLDGIDDFTGDVQSDQGIERFFRGQQK